MRVLIAGCGYVGAALGAALVKQGHRVVGLRRSAGAGDALMAAGIQPWLGNLTSVADLENLPGPFDWVVNTAAPSQTGPAAWREVYFEGNRALLHWLIESPPQKYVFTNSTSVYGQDDGSWVSEESPAVPATETGRILLETERLLLAAARHKFPSVVLRVSGIYGPGRGHAFQQFVQGQARLEAGGGRVMNMVHRDDVAGAIIAALERGKPGLVCNVSDDEPVLQSDFYRWLAERSGRPLPPPRDPADPPAPGRPAQNKRVSNQRLKTVLNYPLLYPTFRKDSPPRPTPCAPRRGRRRSSSGSRLSPADAFNPNSQVCAALAGPSRA